MAPRSTAQPALQQRILLLDDNEHGLKARKLILEEIGYRITSTSDPVEALQLFAQEPFELVITDYKMPNMTGVEFIAHIRAANKDVPIILISGFADALGLTEENTGCDAVIQKSASEVQQLLRSVSRLLRRKTPRKPPGSVPRKPSRSKLKGAS